MDSESHSYSYLMAILNPYLKLITEAFQQEAEKYYQQISDEDKDRFQKLPFQQKQDSVYVFRTDFDLETIEKFYKIEFFTKIIPTIIEIGERYHKGHLQENYTASTIFYEVKIDFREKIEEARGLEKISIPQLRSKGYDNLNAPRMQDYYRWKAKLDQYLFSEAQRIIEEVRVQLQKESKDTSNLDNI